MENLGIQETKELMKFVAALGNGIGKSLEDGKWSVSDLYNFLPALQAATAGISGIDMIDDELLDVDEAELEELKEYAETELDIPQDKTEEFVERSIRVGLDIWFIVKDFFNKGEEGTA